MSAWYVLNRNSAIDGSIGGLRRRCKLQTAVSSKEHFKCLGAFEALDLVLEHAHALIAAPCSMSPQGHLHSQQGTVLWLFVHKKFAIDDFTASSKVVASFRVE